MAVKIEKNGFKNDVNMGRHLGIDFETILIDFGGQLGGGNRTKTGQDRARQGKTKEGKGRERKGRERQGLERKKGRGGVSPRGGGVGSPTL